jgi:hypothetical protein
MTAMPSVQMVAAEHKYAVRFPSRIKVEDCTTSGRDRPHCDDACTSRGDSLGRACASDC